MPLTSPIFLFLFLPVALFTYRLVPSKLKKIYLMAATILFYLWGEWDFVPILLIMVLLNWTLSRYFLLSKNQRINKFSLGLGIFINVAFLTIYKYYYNHLPLGLSFFAFHSISYLVDSFRNKLSSSLVNTGVYLLFFPHISAGPLSKYDSFSKNNLFSQVEFTKEGDIEGVKRFVIGLAKKLILASSYATIVDQIFRANPSTLAFSTALLGLILYSLQLYYDFSGYTDMAIGIARLIGYKLPENFNYPYLATSVTDFWSRWHISLTSWIRQYIYFPLGGNRLGKLRTYLNIMIVFVISGLWHGTGLNFLVWGLWFGLFEVLEKLLKDTKIIVSSKFQALLSRVYTLSVVGVSWVFFRSPNLNYALSYLQRIISINPTDSRLLTPMSLVSPYSLVLIVIGIILATGVQRKLRLPTYIQFIFLTAIFFVSLILTAGATYSPFIYTKF